MDTKTYIVLVSIAIIAWSIFAFFKSIPNDAKDKKISYKIVQLGSYAIFCGSFTYFVIFTKLREEKFFEFKFKYILTMFALATFIMGLRWLIEISKRKTTQDL